MTKNDKYQEYLSKVRAYIEGKADGDKIHFMEQDGSYYPRTIGELREICKVPGMNDPQPGRNDATRAKERKTPHWKQKRK